MSATVTDPASAASWVEIIAPPDVQAEGKRLLELITDRAPQIAEVLKGLRWLVDKDRELYATVEAEAIEAGASRVGDGLGEIISKANSLSAILTVLYEAGIDMDEFVACYHPAEGDQ